LPKKLRELEERWDVGTNEKTATTKDAEENGSAEELDSHTRSVTSSLSGCVRGVHTPEV